MSRLSAIMAEHDRGPEYALVECIECGITEVHRYTVNISDADLRLWFESLGWTIQPTRCPDCAKLFPETS